MVVAIFCGHPDNLEDSDEYELRTVARWPLRFVPTTTGTGGLHTSQSGGRGVTHLSYRRTTPLLPTAQPIFL